MPDENKTKQSILGGLLNLLINLVSIVLAILLNKLYLALIALVITSVLFYTIKNSQKLKPSYNSLRIGTEIGAFATFLFLFIYGTYLWEVALHSAPSFVVNSGIVYYVLAYWLIGFGGMFLGVPLLYDSIYWARKKQWSSIPQLYKDFLKVIQQSERQGHRFRVKYRRNDRTSSAQFTDIYTLSAASSDQASDQLEHSRPWMEIISIERLDDDS